MVYPSPGCETCRKRRVKCDLARPLCGRCRVGQRSCTWDSEEQTGLRFRSENVFAQGRPRRPRQPRARAAVSASLARVSAGQAMPITQLPTIQAFAAVLAQRTLRPALSTPLELQALNFCVRSFFTEDNKLPQIGRELEAFVLPHYDHAQPDSSLQLALTSYSLAVFGRWKGVRPAICRAQRVYARSVVRTQQELGYLSSGNIDEIILAMMLMGRYENIMFAHREPATARLPDEVGTRFFEQVCHEKGASSLLHIRKQLGFPPNPDLDRAIRRQCLRIIILRGAPMPPWFDDGTDWGEEGPSLSLDTLMGRVLVLRNRSISLFKDPGSLSPFTEAVTNIASDAEKLDADLATWPVSLPQEWRYVSEFPALSQKKDSGLPNGGPLHHYSSLAHAALWNRYRALRLITNGIFRRSLNLLAEKSVVYPSSEAVLNQCRKNMAENADDICAGTQCFFDDHASRPPSDSDTEALSEFEVTPKVVYLLPWPLTVAISTEGVPEPQKAWIREKLGVVARILGDTALASVASKGEFKF
ncbi:hypothetical protein GQ53DRAFT_717677 [Thozetella sp. PMI_491]|nr:hypothetical protein GQ53DRAFT_717677 [Thozetella sp. PMI_491]